MDYSIELLDAIYKNVKMATFAIDEIKDKIDNKKLLKLILKQDKIYERISHSCTKIANKLNHELKDINPILKMSSSVSITLKTIANDETCHIAEMLIQGTTMGIIDVIKNNGKNKDAIEELKNLAVDLQQAEEEFVDSLKTFLVL